MLNGAPRNCCIMAITFQFDEGDFGLTVPPGPPSPGTVSPNLATGWDGGMTYVSLNNTDQVAIRTGATGALVLATHRPTISSRRYS